MTMQNSSHPALSAADGLATSAADVALLIGRIMLGWIFVRSGLPKLLDVSAVMATYPGRGLPPMLAYISVPFEFFGALALIFGFATRYVVLGFVIFMLVATFSTHRYWDYPAAQQAVQAANFYKNMAMLGGFLFLFVAGPGRLSIDGWLRRR
jgi:putative oxidoreductase